jgi:hypothetical protein
MAAGLQNTNPVSQNKDTIPKAKKPVSTIRNPTVTTEDTASPPKPPILSL